MRRTHARALPVRPHSGGKTYDTRFRELEIAIFNFLMDLEVRDRQGRGQLLEAAGALVSSLRAAVRAHAPGRLA
jgi:hypothetical protein